MKVQLIRSLFVAPGFLALSVICPLAAPAPAVTSHTAIPLNQIGTVAGKQYSGDGLAVSAKPDGAHLRCDFQRLSADVTARGLSLVSTKAGARGEPFRVVARSLGRSMATPLEYSGRVEITSQMARFIRPGLTEEYSVGIDGLRQDFVIERRPAGDGPMRLELEVDGAKAEAMVDGARLVLDDGGRQIVYNRLAAVDARGRPVAARMEVVSAARLAVVMDDANAEYPVRIDPTFSDANWASITGLPGTGGDVYATAVDSSGNLYLGGSFNIAGNVLATNVAEWNGSSWSALGPGLNAVVNALAVSGSTLYAGGDFTAAGGTPVAYIAQWSGGNWSAVGTGMSFLVSALAVSGSTLYAGGEFTTAGGEPAAYVAQWSSGSWSAVGTGMNFYVNALAVSGSTLYAGGEFTTAGSGAADYVAQWSSGNWSAVGSGMNFYVNALAASGSTLYAGGDFTAATNSGGAAVNATYVAQWDGSSWSTVGEGLNNDVDALAVSGSTLYAGGSFTTATNTGNTAVKVNYGAQWNGSSWSALGSGMSSTVHALAVSGSTLFAGGQFSAAGGAAANDIAEWNGSSWSPLSSGLNEDVYALAILDGNLYVGGFFTGVAGGAGNYVAEWNGSSWSALGGGMNDFVYALAVVGTSLYAGGYFTTATNAGGAAVPVDYVAQWNGSSWLALGGGVSSDVIALTALGTNLYAGGYFKVATNSGGAAVDAPYIAEWNGNNSWSALGSGMNDFVLALAASGTNLYAGGDFNKANGNPADYIAQWNGNSWSTLGGGVNNTVYALAASGTNVYAGGTFGYATNTGGAAVPVSDIAQWNGSSWSALGSGASGTVRALAVSGTNLYAGGTFTTNSGGPGNYIAQWNGSSWSALGSGMNSDVYALLLSDNGLYASGDFTIAGTNVSAYIAEAILVPPLTLSMPTWLSNDRFQMTVNGAADETYTVQMSTNQVSTNWISIWVTNPASMPFLFTDTNATNRARFYRALGEPY